MIVDLLEWKKIWQENSYLIYGLLVLSVAYWFTRLMNWQIWPLFADEAIYIRWAQVMRSQPSLRFLPLSDGKQPLFMWLAMGSLKFINQPVLAGRLVSMLAGWGSLVGISLLARQLFGRWQTGLLAGILYLLFPWSLFFDRMALVDSLLNMWFIWAAYFWILNLDQPKLAGAILTGMAVGMAWLTKSPAIFLFPILLSAVWLKPNWRQTSWSWRLSYLAASLILIALTGVIYNILRLGTEFHQIGLRNQDYVWSWSQVVSDWQGILRHNLPVWWSFYYYYVGILGLVLLLNWRRLISSRTYHWLLAWWLGPSVVMWLFSRNLNARYFLFTTPPLLLLISDSISYLWHECNCTVKKTLIVVGLVVWLAMDSLLIFQPEWLPMPQVERSGYLQEWTAGTGLPQIAQYLQAQSEQHKILVGTEGFFGTTPDGLMIYFDRNPQVTIIGQPPEISQVSTQLINGLSDSQVYLIVNSDRLKIPNPEQAGLKLVQSHPKALRSDGSRQILYLFQLDPEYYQHD